MAPYTLDQLNETLHDKRDWRVRKDAITEFANLGTPEAVDAIISALYDESPHVVQHACRALPQFGKAAISGLVEALYSEKDIASRRYIILALDDFHDPDLIPHFIHFLESEDEGLLSAAAVALNSNPDIRALPHLLKALKNPNAPKGTIVRALSKIGDADIAPDLYPMLFVEDYDATSRFTAIALGKYKTPQTLEMLLEASRHKATFVRSAAAEGLGIDNSDNAYQRLLEMLSDPDNWVRSAVVHALGGTKRSESVPILIKLLNPTEPHIASSLRVGLGETGDLRVVPALFGYFRNTYDHDSYGLSELAETYWNHRKPKAEVFPEILQAIHSTDVNLQICSLFVFHDISFKYAESSQKDHIQFQLDHLQEFTGLLKSDNADIRLSALVSLSHEAVRRAEAEIIQCLDDNDFLIAEMATDALGFINTEAGINALIKTTLRQETKIRHVAIHSLMRLGDERAVESLIELLHHEDDGTKSQAAWALQNFKGKRTVQALLKQLHEEPDNGVKSSIILALGRLGDDMVVSEILTLLEKEDSDPFHRSPFDDALFALSQLKSDKALPAIYRVVNEVSTWQRRMHAVDAIGQVGTEREIADRMFELLGHENDTVRTTASKRLGYLGAQSKDLDLRDYIVSNLIDRLYDKGAGYHYSPTVAHMAAKSLYYVGTTEAIEALKKWKPETLFEQHNDSDQSTTQSS